MSEPFFDFGGEIVWRATPEIIAQSRLKQFMEQYGLATFDELLRYSTTDLEWFWHAVLKNSSIFNSTKPTRKSWISPAASSGHSGCVISAYNTGTGNVFKVFAANSTSAVNQINGLEPPAVYGRLRTNLP